jgi:hypothetical protein
MPSALPTDLLGGRMQRRVERTAKNDGLDDEMFWVMG